MPGKQTSIVFLGIEIPSTLSAAMLSHDYLYATITGDGFDFGLKESNIRDYIAPARWTINTSLIEMPISPSLLTFKS